MQWENLLIFSLWLVPILLGLVFGRWIEARHFRSIAEREQAVLQLPATSLRAPLNPGQVARSQLVHGSVVISIDYFKRALGALRGLIGGPVQSHETLLDRARREAVLRMKERCKGAHEIVNLRIETCSLAGANGSIGSVEVIAYGTALYYRQHEV